MKKTIFNILFVTATGSLIAFCTSCKSSNKRTAAKKETVTDSTRKEEGIAEVSLQQMKTVGIEIAAIEDKNLSSAVKATGQLTVPPQNRAIVNALTGGVIKEIYVVEGQRVAKGQAVAAIENQELIRLQQEYLTSKDNIVYLKQEYERQRTLHDADAGVGKVYQQSTANYAAEQSKLQTLEAQLRQIHINPNRVRKGDIVNKVSVLAPISGTIGKINLPLGSYTDATNPIMEIINNDDIHCDLEVFEKDMADVRVGQRIDFLIANQAEKRFYGKVYSINKSLDSGIRAVTVHGEISNPAHLNLIAGQYVSALIQTGQQVVKAVPKDAIVKVNDKTYIFIFVGAEQESEKKDASDRDTNERAVTEKYRFKMTEVITGVEELGYVEIKPLQELDANIKVVSKGAFYLYSSMQSIDTDDL